MTVCFFRQYVDLVWEIASCSNSFQHASYNRKKKCKYDNCHIGQNIPNIVDSCIDNVQCFHEALGCALSQDTVRAALHVLFVINKHRNVAVAERPCGPLKHTVWVVCENGASLTQEQNLLEVAFTCHTHHRDPKLHVCSRRKYVFLGTLQLSKTGL